MSASLTKFRFFPTTFLARERLSKSDLSSIEAAAIEALKAARKGADIYYLKFEALGRSFCLSSRGNVKNKSVDIECDAIGEKTSNRIITMDDHRRWQHASRRRPDESM